MQWKQSIAQSFSFLHSSQNSWQQVPISSVLHPSFSVQAPWLSRVGAVFVAHGWATRLRMDHICEGLVQAFACGWTTGRARALRGQRWRVAWGKCVVSLQISVADRGGDTWGAVFRPVVSARPQSASQFVLWDRGYAVCLHLPCLGLQPFSIVVPVGHGWRWWGGFRAGFTQAEAHGWVFTGGILEGAVLGGGKGHRWWTCLWGREVITAVTIF